MPWMWTMVALDAPPTEIRDRLYGIGLGASDIAHATSASTSTIRQWEAHESDLRGEPGARLKELNAVVAALIAGDVEPHLCATWLRSKNVELDSRRPIDALGDGDFTSVMMAAQGVFELSRSDHQGEVVIGASAAKLPFEEAKPKPIFISYVREDAKRVSQVCDELESEGITLWRDVHDLLAGMRWRDEIRDAIRTGAGFVAFYSGRSETRDRSYMREELTEAVSELRLRARDRPWFIPVRLDSCEIPDLPIGSGEVLADIQRVDLFGTQRPAGLAQLVQAIRLAIGV